MVIHIYFKDRPYQLFEADRFTVFTELPAAALYGQTEVPLLVIGARPKLQAVVPFSKVNWFWIEE